MSDDFGFAPDPDRARRLDRRMHAELGASLGHVCDASRGIVTFDDNAMACLTRSLAGDAFYSPLLFQHYYALAAALFDEDNARAAMLFDRLVQAKPIDGQQRICALADPAVCEKSAAYQQLMTEDASAQIGLRPPSDEVVSRFAERYERGMALMERTMPELAGEVRAIVREVICVVGDPACKMQFDGGSHFQLWGALFLNADFHPTEQAIVEVVAHESAHSLLFGFCTREPLVFNDDNELYRSPLRQDGRPMDGIFHATFVSARMHWAMSRLLEAGVLSEEARAETLRARQADRDNFEAGYQVVAEHGQLSETGASLMAAARQYMDAAAA